MEEFEQPKVIEEVALRKEKLFSWPVAYGFTVNYILGVGVLAIPQAFQTGGLIISPFLLGFTSLLSLVAVFYLIETQLRAIYLYSIPDSHIQYDTQEAEELKSPLISYSVAKDQQQKMNKEVPSVFEVTELCKIFLWRGTSTAYLICLSLLIYGALWSYSAVFASSLTVNFPIMGADSSTCAKCWSDCPPEDCSACFKVYYTYLAGFGILASILTCLDLSEQVLLQMALTIFRFFALALMIISAIVATQTIPYPEGNTSHDKPYIDKNALLFSAGGVGQILSTACFAQLVQHSCTSIAGLVEDKTKVKYVFSFALLSTFSFYTILGILCALYFGKQLSNPVTLNWSNYEDWISSSTPSHGLKVFAKIISEIIVLFPPIDIISAFPLTGITLGNNIFSFLPDRWTNYGKSRFVKTLCRLTAAIPAILLAYASSRLGLIVSLAGLSGFFIAFVFPPILNYVSAKRMEREVGHSKTVHTTLLSNPIFPPIVLFFGLVAMFVALGEIIYGEVHKKAC